MKTRILLLLTFAASFLMNARVFAGVRKVESPSSQNQSSQTSLPNEKRAKNKNFESALMSQLTDQARTEIQASCLRPARTPLEKLRKVTMKMNCRQLPASSCKAAALPAPKTRSSTIPEETLNACRECFPCD